MDFKASTSASDGPDKIDMSLDDIIRLNKKQRQTTKRGTPKRKFPTKGRFLQGKRGSLPVSQSQRGAITKFGTANRKTPLPAKRRRGQGIITGLAARKSATVFRGINPRNRPVTDQVHQRSRQQTFETQRRRMNVQRRPRRQTEPIRSSHPVSRRPTQPRRMTAPAHQAQKEARQATFLHRRGLKIQAAVQKSSVPPASNRTRQWRTPPPNTGILTVCIDNPSARTQPEPASAWSLHPQTSSSTSTKSEEPEQEKKPPKGVALQFDINSVGKQTAMTLNERFRILKERRVATAATQATKAGRYVTVG